jgi:hypothetical protein
MAKGDNLPVARVYASAEESGAVTKSDSTVLKYQALYIGGAGDVAMKHTEGGDTETWVGLLAGQIYPIQGVRVMAATTATNIRWIRW